MPVVPKVNVIFVGLEAAPIPPGPGYVEISDPTKANEAFDTAIASLPASGGTLYVMPGTVDYEFRESVIVNKPNVTIDFVGGSTLKFSPISPVGGPDLFVIDQPRFRCTGARVVHTITSANNQDFRSCFLVRANDAEISNCTFEVRQGDATGIAIKYFCCVRALLKVGEPDPYRLGLRVTRNTFILDTAGFDQVAPWVPPSPPITTFPVPRGVCGIGIEVARGAILSGNLFRSSTPGVKAPCGPAMFLATVEYTVISSNSFQDLRTPPGDLDGDRGAVVRMVAPVGEGHHTVLSGNVFGDLDTAVVVSLDNVRYDFITSNVFDRIGSATRACWSVIRAKNGAVLGIVANAITRITGDSAADEAAIYLEDLSSVTISGNVFTEVQTGQGAFAVDPGTCENVQFETQQAQAENAS